MSKLVDNDPEELKQQAEKDLEKLRYLLLHQPLTEHQAELQENTREMVKEVVTEAIRDRELTDQSVSKVLIPVVEESMQHSFTRQRGEMLNYIFPLVGDLVRKYVAASLRDFIEKTNEIIEKSVSMESIFWRYRAWRAGMPYATYVASQTYVFQIHNVLLIHKETGALLNAVNLTNEVDENSELVSAMLTAINDFVADSFSSKLQHDQQLDEIKTDDFTLFIKQGPSVALVASVTGSISPSAKAKLQSTLEYIHKLYIKEIQNFDGDKTPFAETTPILEECLLFEEKSTPPKKAWFAWVFIGILAGLAGWYAYLSWQTSNVASSLRESNTNNGIVVTSASVRGLQDIELTLLRDKSAISVSQWLESLNLPADWIQVNEISFISDAPEVIDNKIQTLIKEDPRFNYNEGKIEALQSAQYSDVIALEKSLSAIPGIDLDRIGMPTLKQDRLNSSNESTAPMIRNMIGQLSAQLASIQVLFDVNQSTMHPQAQSKLDEVVSTFQRLKQLAENIQITPTLLIIGASDTLGAQSRNEVLSIERASKVRRELLRRGLLETEVVSVAASQIETSGKNSNARKVIFAALY
ncbi:OmpA family protein [Glaciecola sp. 1036]|uniref:OmpA family protein n=1 Tax=Alteromonadaceae TaxID=72275 RepID=UPI003CFF4C65